MSLKRKFLLCLVFMFSGMLLVVNDSYAGPTVTIVSNPPKEYVEVKSSPRPITLTVATSGKIKQYHWEIITGPGSLKGRTTDSAIAYVPPKKIDQELLEVWIMVTVTDSRGETASNQVKFYLHQDRSGSDSKNFPTPTPTPTPTPGKTILQLLQEGDAFFKQQWYLFQREFPEGGGIEPIKPHKDSAFGRYKEVLEREPGNRHARKKIQEIMEKYAAFAELYCQRWRANGYKQEDREKAKKFYNLSLFVAQYRQNTLGDIGESQIEEIQRRLQELNSFGYIRVFVDVPNVKVYINHQYQGVAHPEQPGDYKSSPGQVIIQVKAEKYPIETKTEIIHPKQWNNIRFKLKLHDLLDKADKLFKLKRFLTTKAEDGEVAFDLYKEVLESDPSNERALEKINAIMEIYKTWGDKAYKRRHFKSAKLHYSNYLIIALYRLNVLKDRSILEEIEEVQKRLSNL